MPNEGPNLPAPRRAGIDVNRSWRALCCRIKFADGAIPPASTRNRWGRAADDKTVSGCNGAESPEGALVRALRRSGCPTDESHGQKSGPLNRSGGETGFGRRTKSAVPNGNSIRADVIDRKLSFAAQPIAALPAENSGTLSEQQHAGEMRSRAGGFPDWVAEETQPKK